MQANLFAEVPGEPAPVVALVRQQLERECEAGRCPRGDGLDRLAEEAVLELWDAPVKSFVPLLALRRVREALTDTGGGEPVWVAAGWSGTPAPIRDGLPAAGDVLRVDESDVLRLDGADVLHVE